MADEAKGCEFPAFNAPDAEIEKLLKISKTIAVVGLSPNPARPSFEVSAYMQSQGYRIIPVNPGHPEILGEKSYRSLTDIPDPVDIVNIFRRPEFVGEVVDQAIRIKAKVVWMQEGIVNNEAAEKAKVAGLIVVMNKCILKEHMRFG